MGEYKWQSEQSRLHKVLSNSRTQKQKRADKWGTPARFRAGQIKSIAYGHSGYGGAVSIEFFDAETRSFPVNSLNTAELNELIKANEVVKSKKPTGVELPLNKLGDKILAKLPASPEQLISILDTSRASIYTAVCILRKMGNNISLIDGKYTLNKKSHHKLSNKLLPKKYRLLNILQKRYSSIDRALLCERSGYKSIGAMEQQLTRYRNQGWDIHTKDNKTILASRKKVSNPRARECSQIWANKVSKSPHKSVEKPSSATSAAEFKRIQDVYASLPIGERRMPIVVLDNEPISWKLAYREIEYGTKFGQRIFDKLVEMKFI